MTISLEEDKQLLKSEMLQNKTDFKHMGKSGKTLTITIVGDKGTGKTLYMCIISVLYSLLGKDFYTNFTLHEKIKGSKEFNIRNLYDNPNVEAIFLDEMHNICDQNSNNSLATSLMVALFTQSRKRNQLIMMTTLRFYMLAKDIRYLTNIIIYPELNEETEVLTLTFWDLRDNSIYTKSFHHVSRFYPLYDTHEIIASERVKDQLSNYMLGKKKLRKDLEKELDENDLELIDNLDERLQQK